MLHINDITYRIGDRTLFNKATAAINAGHKVGFVGRNGSGKSTLLRIILGEIGPELGGINVPRRTRVGAVAQEAPGTDVSLLNTVLEADTEREELLARAETETDPNEIAEIQTRLADIEAHSAPARAATILAGLGFSEEDQQRPCSEFSGGWRMRVALAAVLFAEPDLLLLDEPTNYLDLEGTLWLESYLRSYPYTVLLVSHDRDLLNKVVDHILHLEDEKLTLYTGGYDQFEATRRARLELQMAMKKKQEAERRHIQSFVDRFRYKESKARQAQSRIKMLARMQPIAAVMEQRVVPFKFPQPDRLSPPIITMEQASVGYEPGKAILRDLDLRIDQDDVIALLGANGNGKSTFAKLLSDRLKAETGRVRRSPTLKIGYFAQHQLDELNERWTPYAYYQDLLPDKTEAQRRAQLGAVGFGKEKSDTVIANLSGGEKARLLLALAVFHKPHMLILDEPTNHLDVDSREALVQAINDYEGAVLIISHDRHLIATCADRLWLVEQGGVHSFEGDIDDYREHLLALRRGSRNQKRRKGADDRADARREKAARREDLQPLKDEVTKWEGAIAKLNEQIEKIDAALADQVTYAGPPERAKKLNKKRSEIAKMIVAAEARWIAASEVYDEALSG